MDRVSSGDDKSSSDHHEVSSLSFLVVGGSLLERVGLQHALRGQGISVAEPSSPQDANPLPAFTGVIAIRPWRFGEQADILNLNKFDTTENVMHSKYYTKAGQTSWGNAGAHHWRLWGTGGGEWELGYDGATDICHDF